MSSTLDPTNAEQDCNQAINLNDDEEEKIFNAPVNPPANTNAIKLQNGHNDEDDDFFAELGGQKYNRPNPSVLVENTKPFQNSGDNNSAENVNSSTNTNDNSTNNATKIISNLSKEIQDLSFTKGDDEPSDINITVTDPRKIGDSFIDTFIVFRVRTVISPNTETAKIFRNNKEATVDRRFSDFLGFYEKMKAKYQHKGILVPPPPEKDIKSLAKVKLSSNDTEATELNAIARRRSALERFLNRMAAHSVLREENFFVDFLTNPNLQSSKSTTAAFSLNGIKKVFKSAEDQVLKLAKPYVEQDAWFDEKQNSVERVHHQYVQLYVITTQMYRTRREMGDSFIILSQELGGLVQLEKVYDKSGYLSDLCSKLGQTYNDIQRAVAIQQKVDCFDLAEVVGDHVRILEAVKDLLFVRTRAFQAVVSAEENLYTKKQSRQHAESEAKFDKIPKLEYEIGEWTKNVDKAKQNFVELSNTIKKEISVYEIKRAVRMRQSVKAYLEQLANHHLKMADIWKEYLNNSKLL